MNELSKYSDKQMRNELDRRTRKAKNAKSFVRCKDCTKPDGCKYNGRLKQGVWRYCEDYTAKNN